MAEKLESELLLVLGRVDTGQHKQRNLAIIKRYLGFDGQPGVSMQKAGEPYGLTRESVRQIMNRFSSAIRDTSPAMPTLERTLKVIHQNLPSDASTILAVLVDADLVAPGTSIDLVIQAARLFRPGSKVPVVVRHRKTFLILTPEQAAEELHIQVAREANRRISRNGAVSIASLAGGLKGIKPAVRERFVRAVMVAMPNTRWVNDDWLYYNGHGRNCLLRRLHKVFHVMESAPLGALRKGLARSLKGGDRLPESVLVDLLRVDGTFDIDANHNVRALKDLSGETHLLRKYELDLVEQILARPDGTAREKELEDALVNDVSEKFSFSMALSQSPLIYRLERGRYTVVGKPRQPLPFPERRAA